MHIKPNLFCNQSDLSIAINKKRSKQLIILPKSAQFLLNTALQTDMRYYSPLSQWLLKNLYELWESRNNLLLPLLMSSCLFLLSANTIYIYNLARTPEIGQGLGRILSCGACKPEQT